MNIFTLLKQELNKYIRTNMNPPQFVYLGFHYFKELELATGQLRQFTLCKEYSEITEQTIFGMKVMQVSNDPNHLNVA